MDDGGDLAMVGWPPPHLKELADRLLKAKANLDRAQHTFDTLRNQFIQEIKEHKPRYISKYMVEEDTEVRTVKTDSTIVTLRTTSEHDYNPHQFLRNISKLPDPPPIHNFVSIKPREVLKAISFHELPEEVLHRVKRPKPPKDIIEIEEITQ